MRARMFSRALVGALALVAALALAPPLAAAPAARLEVSGCSLASHEVSAMFAQALRAPRDSSATRLALAALLSRLEDHGHLDAGAAAMWDTSAAPRLAVQVREGPRYRFAGATIDAPSRDDSLRLARALAFSPDAVASPGALGVSIRNAVGALAGDAYPYVVLGVSAWQADSGLVHLRLSGALGPRVTVAAIRIDGLHVTRREVAMRAIGRMTGAPFKRSAAEEGRDRLEALGLFRSVTYEGLEGESDWSRAHVVYRVEEPRYNAFEGAVGVQGHGGTVGLARLDLGNLLGTGRAIGLRWESRGKGVSQFGAHAAEPQLAGLPVRLEGHVAQEVQDSIYVRTRWGLNGVFALSGREHIEAGYEAERVVQEHDVVEEADLDNTVFALEGSTLDRPVGARHGMRLRLGATEMFKRERLRPSGTNSERASIVDLGFEWHRPIRAATGLDLELRAHGRSGTQSVLPFFERTPLGGATTLRGYDEDQFHVDRFALSRLEWSRFLGAPGARAFLLWDHAWMSTRVADSAGDHAEAISRDGFGFGLRLPAGGGIAGLDYGLAAGQPPSQGKIHVRLVSQF
jgi:outer membrane protein assembly factor BamA